MTAALTMYVVLVLPAILGSLAVARRVLQVAHRTLDLIERIEARRDHREP